MIDQMTPKERLAVEEWYYMERKLQLNPELFLNDGDSFIIITGRSEKVRFETEWWVDKYCPNCKKLIMVDLGPSYGCTNGEVKDWSKEQARRKAEIINKEKVDVYFEDNGECVLKLRKLCPNTKIIKFGGNMY
jgi:hypothetical protein